MSLADTQERATRVLAAIPPKDAQQARQVILELACTATGSIPNYGGSGRGVAGSREPVSGDPRPPHHELIARIAGASGVGDVRAAVEWGRRELDALRVRPAPVGVVGESVEARAVRIVRVGEGWEVAVVAASLGVPVGEVRRARVAAGRDAFSGLLPGGGLVEGERRVRVRELAAAKWPVPSIAGLLGVGESTVRRDLGRKAR